MDIEELKKVLKEHLSIEISESTSWGVGCTNNDLDVKILFDEEVISESSVTLSQGD